MYFFLRTIKMFIWFQLKMNLIQIINATFSWNICGPSNNLEIPLLNGNMILLKINFLWTLVKEIFFMSVLIYHIDWSFHLWTQLNSTVVKFECLFWSIKLSVHGFRFQPLHMCRTKIFMYLRLLWLESTFSTTGRSSLVTVRTREVKTSQLRRTFSYLD